MLSLQSYSIQLSSGSDVQRRPHCSADVKFSVDQWGRLQYVFRVWRLAEVWTFTQSDRLCVYGHGQAEWTKRTTYRQKSGAQVGGQCRVQGAGAGCKGRGRGWGMTCTLRALTPDPDRRIQGMCLWKQLDRGRRQCSWDGRIGRWKERRGVVSGLIREGWKMDSIPTEGWGQPGYHHVKRHKGWPAILKNWCIIYSLPPSFPLLIFVNVFQTGLAANLLSCRSLHSEGFHFTFHISNKLQHWHLSHISHIESKYKYHTHITAYDIVSYSFLIKRNNTIVARSALLKYQFNRNIFILRDVSSHYARVESNH